MPVSVCLRVCVRKRERETKLIEAWSEHEEYWMCQKVLSPSFLPILLAGQNKEIELQRVASSVVNFSVFDTKTHFKCEQSRAIFSKTEMRCEERSYLF